MSRIGMLYPKLWANYPLGDAESVKKTIGGHVNAPEFKNTCVIRLSRAFNLSNEFIPGPSAAKTYGMNVVSGADKHWYAYRVSEFHKYLKTKYGPPLTVNSMGKIPGEIVGKPGVIEFVVNFSDATGHFDVWNGSRCKYEEFFARAAVIHLWS